MYSVLDERHQQAWRDREFMRSRDALKERTANSMKRFFVTFGIGTILRGYHQEFQAVNEDVVRAFMNRKARMPWASIYTEQPKGTKALQDMAEVLHYAEAAHV